MYRNVSGVGSSVTERDPEALSGADHQVGAPLTGRGEHGEGKKVGGDGGQGPHVANPLGQGSEVPHGSGRARELQHHTEEVRVGETRCEVAHHGLHTSGFASSLYNRDGLRQTVGVEHNPLGPARGGTAHHRDRFGRGCRLVEQGGVGGRQAGQVGHHGLKVDKGFQPALADLGLVRGISRVPGRVLEHVPPNHRRSHRAVIPEADHGLPRGVEGGQAAQLGQHLSLADRRWELNLSGITDVGRYRRLNQILERGVAQPGEHLRLIGGRQADVAAGEGARGGGGGGGLGGGGGWAVGRGWSGRWGRGWRAVGAGVVWAVGAVGVAVWVGVPVPESPGVAAG